MGKNLIYIGVVLVIVGGIWTLLGNIGYKNPLDLKFESGNTKIYFPIGTCILISILLTILFYFFRKFWKKPVWIKIKTISRQIEINKKIAERPIKKNGSLSTSWLSINESFGFKIIHKK